MSINELDPNTNTHIPLGVTPDPDIAEILKRLDKPRTPKEIAAQKEQKRKELLAKGFLPPNEEYSPVMAAPMEFVEPNPRQFIIEECVPACIELWRKNIYTFMVSDHYNEGVCWIEIDLDALSDENKKIYEQLSGDDVNKFPYHQGCINFGVNCVGTQAQKRLLELANLFQMQDVPHKLAWFTVQEYLMNICDCYEEIANPEYEHMSPPWEGPIPEGEDISSYFLKYKNWQNSNKSQETIRVYSPEKAKEKKLEEHVRDKGGVLDLGEERVYRSQYHYQKHQNYLQHLASQHEKK